MTSGSRPKVLYVLGTQRGGTTIAGRLMGQLPGFSFIGELRKLWEIGLAGDRRCGCGQSYATCEVWSAVLPTLLAGVDIAEVGRWQREAVPARWSSLQSLRLSGNGNRRPVKAVDSYRSTLAATYRGLADATGSRVLVDTSKAPADAALISRMDEIDTFFVHLVRDPRGTVHSIIRRSGASTGGHLRQTVSGSAGWLARHAAAAALVRHVARDRSLVISYEDMVSDPNAVLARVAALVGEPPPPSPVVVDGKAALAAAHTPLGGRRFDATTVTLTLDDSWVVDLSTLDRLVVTGLTQPLARRFGYPMSPPATGRGA